MDVALTNATNAISLSRESNPVERLPVETLLYIFELAEKHFNASRQEPSFEIENSHVPVTRSKDLRFKSKVVRVCKRWRGIIAPLMYECICLYRIGQLVALVKGLEAGGCGSLVQHIHGRLLVLPHWEDLYFKYVVRLLELCTSARSLTWRVIWNRPNIEPVSVRCSTINFMLLSSPSIHLTLKSLRKLTLQLNRPVQQGQSRTAEDNVKLTFDSLEDLVCEATNDAHAEGLSFISSSFLLPQISKLTIKASPDASYLLVDDPHLVYGVLVSHGAKLSSLALDMDWASPTMSRWIGFILDLTPNLHELEVKISAFRSIDPDNIVAGHFPNLLKLRLVISDFHISANKFKYLYRGENYFESKKDAGLTNYFSLTESRKVFPSLQTIALLHDMLPRIPLDSMVSPTSHYEVYSYLSSWAKKLQIRGITLVDVGEEIIAPTGPKRWTGRFALEETQSDPEDLAYPSDDDEAHRTGSSEYSSWDSEPEDGVSDPEDREHVAYSDVGSDDMMEIFKDAIMESSGDEAEDEMEVE
ncbi:hypothetical protein SCHPADRAFT_998717 [Schizopora paradoxa]|uniref:Uncharacterized protein n=1 Tax=Schizopora paradoxa TaxID=27342 RepID=A0A0H2RI51_9AGAM|nr:hypothetical protein SCHPADRAFT_998717 [Schizopora paradoxa]